MRSAAVVCALLLPLAWAGPAAAAPTFDPDAIYDVPLDDAPRRGPDDALVTIVEFSDFACGFCNRMQPVMKQLDRLYPGQLRWVFRTLPLDEDEGTLASEAAIAAGRQGRFWPMHDRLFAVAGRVDRAAVEVFAVELGLDLARFRADLDSGEARAIVGRELAAGKRLGLTGTPAFFINGRAIPGAAPLSSFLAVVGDELARARAARADYAALIAGGRARADSEAEPREPLELSATRTYRVGLGLPGHRIGPDDAAVTIVVWSDFLCPYCAQQAPVLERLRAAHPADVRVVYRHYPLPMHPGADLAAEAAVEAGRQGKFWPFHDQVFAAGATGAPMTRAILLERGAAVGLDVAALAAALDDHRHRDAVLADAAGAMSVGAGSTPTLFVNGLAIAGMTGHDELEARVAAEVARARDLQANGVPAAEVYGVIALGADVVELGDPRRLPRGGGLRIEPGAVERASMVLAACRAGERAEAIELAARLRDAARAAVRATCGDRGIDLP